MISSFRRALPALVAIGAVTCAQAAPQELRTTKLAMEVPVKSITLPVTETSPAVMPTCADCPLKSFPTTKDTAYYSGRERISLAELKTIVLQHPDLLLTVSYAVDTGNLVSITADIPRASH